MKLRKILVMILMCMCLMGGATPSVNAAETRGVACPKCEAGNLKVSKTYGSWYNTGNQRACQHMAYGTDIQQARNVTTVNKCNSCNYGYSSTKKMELSR